MQYRRLRNSDTWHFCQNCSNWPDWEYISVYKKPKDGKFCSQCEAKLNNHECHKQG